jgi:serine beta-lactamase-like protein LACTB, mitochondrial
MKILIAIVCFVFSISLFPGCHTKKDGDRFFDYKYKKVLKEARQEAVFYQARNFIPGSSIAVSVNGKLVWSEGIGVASTDLEVQANRYTKYRIGQISQVLTAIAYYQMVEKGKLSPTDDFRKYLPDFPEKKYPIKLLHLVSQSSGIRPPNDKEADFRGLNVSFQGAIEYVYQDTLLFPPGMYNYPTFFASNILGAVMEKASGESFTKIIRKNVTDTLHMLNTTPDNPFITIKGRSNFYDRNIVAQVVNALTMDFRYRQPAEGYLSTAEDLVKLGNALLFSPVLSDSVRHWMLTAPVNTENYQMNWGNGLMFLKFPDGKPFIASRGLVKSSGAMLIIIPDEKIVLGWLSNLNDDIEELPGVKVAMMFKDFHNGTFGKKTEMNQPPDSLTVK